MLILSPAQQLLKSTRKSIPNKPNDVIDMMAPNLSHTLVNK
jgi:hypothetical protein